MSDVTIVTKRDFKEFQTELLDAIETKFKSELIIFTGKELSKALRVKANTLSKFRTMGLPFIRMDNGNYLYDKKDVEKFISEHKFSHLKEL
ncbi:hypothetical protein ACXR6G_19025 [Ancylomarina sp. YFZ004]